jgi:uncharacterized membrane protein YebE (DUF533 family)
MTTLKSKIAKIVVTSSLLIGSAGVALAAGDSWRQKQIDETQAREAGQIEAGRYKGDLTRREYRDLLAEQNRIAEMERKAKADGYVSKREFREIREAQVNASQHIKSESTDGQVSFWRKWLYNSRY